MKVLNFGSLNLDMVYRMEHMVRKGETLAAERLDKFPGGKGLNQSVALARAGAKVFHAGNIGPDGEMLTDILKEAKVNTLYVHTVEETTGHAVIQVDEAGDNSIMLYAGANGAVTSRQIDTVLQGFEKGDWLVLQNEINMLGEIMNQAYAKGMRIVLNPSPISPVIRTLPLEKVSIFMLNEIEGQEMTGKQEPEEILDALLQAYPGAAVVLTLGSQGSVYADAGQRIHQDIYKVKAVDTTAAGDTFTGFFISVLLETGNPQKALDTAAKASALAVSRKGAAPSIPVMEEVVQAELKKEGR